MTKLIIQIPCYNEEASLPSTLAALPRSVPGVDVVEWLVIDDGSADRTVEVAKTGGVHHVVRLPSHRGLARAFMAGLENCLQAGADIIVNLDADNQYCADDIPKLIEPILQHRAELVVGTRPVAEIEHFSPIKKWLNRLGSRVVQLASKAEIPDAPSGFRAISRDAALRINVFSEYTYTLETIIQAGQKGMGVLAVPIRVNPGTRPSRLVKSVPDYVLRSVATILRIFVTYRPLRFFAFLGAVFIIPGLLLGLRYVYFYFTGHGSGHVQSVILCGLLMGTGFFLLVTALVVDLIAVNRMFLERVDWRLKKVEEQLRGNGRNA
jgi:glycosyltransferase involved in cell wall biosynthesis